MHALSFAHGIILDLHHANMCHGDLKTMQSYANPNGTDASSMRVARDRDQPDSLDGGSYAGLVVVGRIATRSSRTKHLAFAAEILIESQEHAGIFRLRASTS
jgi:hypothetical protein